MVRDVCCAVWEMCCAVFLEKVFMALTQIVTKRCLSSLWHQRSQQLSSSFFVHATRALRLGATRSITFTFYEERSGDKIEVTGEPGKKVLDIALDNNIDIEGACGGELACSTCHVKMSKELFDKLPPKQVEEDDMLDLAWGVSDT
jgi:ferredoxin